MPAWKPETRQPSQKAMARATFLTDVLIPRIKKTSLIQPEIDHDSLYIQALAKEYEARHNLAGGRHSSFSEGCALLGDAFKLYAEADTYSRAGTRYSKDYLNRRRWQAIARMQDMFTEAAAYMGTKLPATPHEHS